MSTDTTEAPIGQIEEAIARLVERLVENGPVAVTYDQIVSVMLQKGYDPSEAPDVYDALIDALEQRNILVVETLEQDLNWIDEDAFEEELAKEAWDMLKNARVSIDEYKHPVLSVASERRLMETYKNGKRAQKETNGDMSRERLYYVRRQIEAGEQALDEIMRCNLRLVAKIAVRYARFTQHLTLDDLIQEGRIGLYKAIERYDLDLNLKLSTYAMWWIRQSIERAIADGERDIRIPVHAQEALRRLKRESERLVAMTGTEPTDKELAALLGMPITKVQFLRSIDRRMISLDTPIAHNSDGDVILSNLIPDAMEYEPSRMFDQQYLQDTLRVLLDQLTEREKQVISWRFGLNDGKERTLENVGRMYGVTRERIRQIEKKALNRLGSPRSIRYLKDFLVQ